MLSNIIINSAEAEVLDAFILNSMMKNPDNLTENDLMNKCGISSKRLKAFLVNLEDQGLIEVSRIIGKTKVYKLSDNEAGDYLKLFVERLSLIKILKAEYGNDYLDKLEDIKSCELKQIGNKIVFEFK